MLNDIFRQIFKADAIGTQVLLARETDGHKYERYDDDVFPTSIIINNLNNSHCGVRLPTAS